MALADNGGTEPMRIGTQLFDLPKSVLTAVTDILDCDDNWLLLGELVSLRSDELSLIGQCASTRSASSSGELLRVLAARGYTVDHLYGLLAKLRLARVQSCIELYVHEEYKQFFHPDDYANYVSGDDDSAPAVDRGRAGAGTVTVQCARSAGTSRSSAKEESESEQLHHTLASTLAVPYDELSAATEGFDAKYIVGRGGYGVVYKAEWKHSTVAVKRIASDKAAAGAATGANAKAASAVSERERWRQSLVEMRALALYRHDHILPLYGYALDGPEPLLVYQFMAGGSFEDRLQRRQAMRSLTWPERVSIALGTALALHYLHAQTPQPLIHGDVKTGNILLDKHLVSRLGDFGLSRYGHMRLPSGAPPLIASHVKGTLAYLPPEFLCHKQLSTKLDVYSLGVVLMEAATGCRAYTAGRQPQALAAYVLDAAKAGGRTHTLPQLIDDCVTSDGDGAAAVALLHTAVRCCAAQPDDRPEMAILVQQLQSMQ